MRRKEERSKQGQTNKQEKATQHTQGSHFPGKNELHVHVHVPQVGLNPRHSTLQTERSTTELPRQLSWLGPNLTSHNTPDKQAYLHVQVHVHVHVYNNVYTMYMYSTCLSDLWSYESGRGREGGREGGKVGGREGYCVVKQYTVHDKN